MYRENRCVEPEKMMSEYPSMGSECMPVYECPCEKVCHREINHEIKHVQPVNTRIINHHIYHHVYVPCFTTCEEDEVCHVYDCNPCNK